MVNYKEEELIDGKYYFLRKIIFINFRTLYEHYLIMLYQVILDNINPIRITL